MSEHFRQKASALSGSFFTAAAWYGFLVPLITPVIWFLIMVVTQRIDVPFMSAFCILVTSFILGVVSLIGFSRHGRKLILWVAVVGIIASVALGFLSLVYWDMAKNFHG